MKLADFIAQRIAAEGVRSVFAVAGASHAHLLDALDRKGVHIVSSRHETGAVSGADGYARTRRGLGVALIVAEQGLANAVGGLAAAFLAGSPVLVIAAAAPRRLIEPGNEVRDAGLGSTLRWCRFAGLVNRAEELPGLLDNAIGMTRHGRPGPAVLFLPGDLLAARLENQPASRASSASFAAPGPPRATIARAADLLAGAQRPLILAGAGAYWSGAGAALARVAEAAASPIAGNGLGRGLIPEDWHRSFSWPYAQIAACDADVVLVAGARLTQRTGFGLPPRFASDARFVQIDIDEREAQRSRPIDVFLHADAKQALDSLADELEMRRPDPQRHDWLHAALAPRAARVRDTGRTKVGAIHPLRLGREIAAQLPPASVYVGDGADIQSWMYGAIAIRQAPGFMDHYPMGAMGIGTPLAVGAATAVRDGFTGKPDLPTVLVTGDGSLGFYPAELHAAALAKLRLVVIVGNDGAWGTEVHEQRQAIGRSLNTELGQLPYEKLAEAFGCKGFRVEHPDELEPALVRAFAEEGPVLVNVLLDREAGAQLKSDPLLRMILFSDLAEGRRAIGLNDD